MRRFRWVSPVVVVGLAGALVGVVPDGVLAVARRSGCRPTAFVSNAGVVRDPGSHTVSTIDVKTRTKHPDDIPVGFSPHGVVFTPDGKTAFVTNQFIGTVSTIDVKTRRKDPDDIPVGKSPTAVAITRDGKTAFVANRDSNSVDH